MASDEELHLIARPAPAPGALAPLYWGTVGGGLIADTVSDVPAFLAATGLERAELVALVASRFVNPAGALRLRAESSSPGALWPDVERLHGVDAGALDRLHRFTRLRRCLDWSVETLDLAITAVAPQHPVDGDLEPVLRLLIKVDWLRRRLGLPVEEVCGLWVRDQVPDSLRRSLGDAAPQPFPWNQSISLIDAEARPVRLRLARAAEISERDLLALATGLGFSGEGAHARLTLSPETVLTQVRYGRLSRLLDVPIADLLVLDIADPGPASRWQHGEDLYSFVRACDSWRASGSSLRDLAAMLPLAEFAAALQRPIPVIADREPDIARIAGRIPAGPIEQAGFAFADTLFAYLPGVGEDVSRSAIRAIPALFVEGDASGTFRLSNSLDEALARNGTPEVLLVLQALGLPHDAAEALETLLRSWRVTSVVTARLAACFQVSTGKMERLLRLADATIDPAAFWGSSDGQAASLEGLVRDVRPLAVLLRHPVFDEGLLDLLVADRAASKAGTPPRAPILGPPHGRVTLVDVRRARALAEWFDAARDRAHVPAERYRAPDIGALVTVIQFLAHPTGPAPDASLAAALRVELTTASTLWAYASSTESPIDGLQRMVRCARLAQALGDSAGAPAAIAAATTFADWSACAAVLRGTLRSRLRTDAACDAALGGVADGLRSRKRDALVEYIRSSDPEHPDLDALSSYFLFDVQVEGCARTTCLVAATNSLQRYVERCRLGLEKTRHGTTPVIEVPPASIDPTEWDWWRGHYRYWEANRKVFLWPENYLETDLRDDKTPLFKELEQTLLQGQIDKERILDAYATYLSGFEEIGALAIAGAYHDDRPDGDVLHLFGVTRTESPVYYYREICGLRQPESRGVHYGPWQKLNLQIPVRVVSPYVYLGRLYLFWVEIASRQKTRFASGDSQFTGYQHTLKIKCSTQRGDGSWTAPQALKLDRGHLLPSQEIVIDDKLVDCVIRLSDGTVSRGVLLDPDPGYKSGKTPDLAPSQYHIDDLDAPPSDYALTGFRWNRVFPSTATDGSLLLTFGFPAGSSQDPFKDGPKNTAVQWSTASLKPVDRSLIREAGGAYLHLSREGYLSRMQFTSGYKQSYSLPAMATVFSDPRREDEVPAARHWGGRAPFSPFAQVQRPAFTEITPVPTSSPWSPTVGALLADTDLRQQPEVVHVDVSCLNTGWTARMQRFSTYLARDLVNDLFIGGIDAVLRDQTRDEGAFSVFSPPVPTGPNQAFSDWPVRIVEADGIDFRGALGVYFREVFFEIPLRIAEFLHSQKKYRAARDWYHYIFDPTAARPASPTATGPGARAWRCAMFWDVGVPDLRKDLSDPAALWQYRTNPFMPHAIARLRYSAYEKRVVFKYVENLLDWGDELFGEFTRESVNQASLLYTTATELLGPRPEGVGDCPEQPSLTYKDLGRTNWDSPFLLEVESAQWAAVGGGVLPAKRLPTAHFTVDADLIAAGGLPDRPPATRPGGATDGAAPMQSPTPPRFGARPPMRSGVVTATNGEGVHAGPDGGPVIQGIDGARRFSSALLGQLGRLRSGEDGPGQLLFCVPHNPDLDAWWDRVEDRLYKIRHCMDITGARRELPLLAPEIDPRLLVRARAEGLSPEDVAAALSGEMPPYRFAYLIEKAKQYAAQVQAFGGALLAAIERKDAEELARLRLVHEQAILTRTRKSREQEVAIAEESTSILQQQRTAVEARRDHYDGLLLAGSLGTEIGQIAALTGATLLQTAATVVQTASAVSHAAGAAVSVTPSGTADQTGKAGSSGAEVLQWLGGISHVMSVVLGQLSQDARRADDWRFQRDLASLDLSQLDTQIRVAGMREELAREALANHEKTLEQLEEVFAFYGEKFSNLGLHEWQVRSLEALYRQAWSAAWGMACLARQAYRFERDDDTTPLLTTTMWEPDRAGLLAGERLALDLQAMERRFLETNYRTMEVDQAFSLAQFDPLALLRLRQTGTCTFRVPELFFDLHYPGQYRRRLKGVRLTIPCVTGPYTNVAATLTLQASWVRREAKAAGPLAPIAPRRNVQVATSTAQSDPGVFEFSFRDERYMPFEGCGAISTWELRLPSAFRAFDYQTINDVVLHLSYTALYDTGLREAVEEGNRTTAATLLAKLRTDGFPAQPGRESLVGEGLWRVFSLRQEYSREFSRLARSGGAAVRVDLAITGNHLPWFVRVWPLGREQSLVVTRLFMLVRTERSASMEGCRIVLDGLSVPNDFSEASTDLNLSPDGSQYERLWINEIDITGQDWKLVRPSSENREPHALEVTWPAEPDKLLDVLIAVHYVVGGHPN